MSRKYWWQKQSVGDVLPSSSCLGIVREATSWRFPSLFWGPPTLDALDDESPLNITVSIGSSVGDEWLDGLDNLHLSRDAIERTGTRMTPPLWDSGRCMEIHGTPKLQTEVDPGGYLIFTEGREQLGNNRILISDGLVIAKALNRTLVEFPMADSRIARPDAERGMCKYWDCDALCNYHRVLDLWAFRSMLGDGTVSNGGFLEIESANKEQRLLPSLVTTENITDYFEEYREAQVIVLKMAWKSGLQREPLEYLTPNPFYKQAVTNVVSEQKGWEEDKFLAVQWRTETSTGNLSWCYERYVRPVVEEQRELGGFGKDQVFFNTDLTGHVSTTYNLSAADASKVLGRISADYPSALNNRIYDSLSEEQDAGIRAMVSGHVSASSEVLLSSSFNGSGSGECQKPHSKYIDLVANWRSGDVYNMDPNSIVRIFPDADEDDGGTSPWYGVAVFVLIVVGFVYLSGKRGTLRAQKSHAGLPPADAMATSSTGLLLTPERNRKHHSL